ncbi:MAG: DUF5667 domain-containing protein, partial [Chloroflexi bacterium]|nr:DUF5667 domain-containing protein [Chloroflexota bacterium]
AEGLEPILQAAVSARTEFGSPMPAIGRSRVRGRLLDEWDRKQRRWSWSVPGFVPQWAAITALVVVLAAVGGGGTVAASGGAVPGDALYGVKVLREEAQLWLTRSPEAKVSLYTSLVKERVEEIRILAERRPGSVGAASRAVERLDEHLTSFDREVAEKVGREETEPAAIPEFMEEVGRSVQEQRAAQSVLERALLEAPEGSPGGAQERHSGHTGRAWAGRGCSGSHKTDGARVEQVRRVVPKTNQIGLERVCCIN